MAEAPGSAVDRGAAFRRVPEFGEGQVAAALQPTTNIPQSAAQLIIKARTSWLKGQELLTLLELSKQGELPFSTTAATRPPGGSIFLYDRKVVRSFRLDGHNWRKKHDGKTVRETHEKLKLENVETINCYYAHALDPPTLQRRCYWLLDNDNYVLVHYVEMNPSCPQQHHGHGQQVHPSMVSVDQRSPMGMHVNACDALGTASSLQNPNDTRIGDIEHASMVLESDRCNMQSGALQTLPEDWITILQPQSWPLGARYVAGPIGWPKLEPLSPEPTTVGVPGVLMPWDTQPSMGLSSHETSACQHSIPGFQGAPCRNRTSLLMNSQAWPKQRQHSPSPSAHHPHRHVNGNAVPSRETPSTALRIARPQALTKSLGAAETRALDSWQPAEADKRESLCTWEISPETVRPEGGEKVLIVGSPSPNIDLADRLFVDVDGQRCEAAVLTSGVVSFIAPPHEPGTASLTIRDERGRLMSACADLKFAHPRRASIQLPSRERPRTPAQDRSQQLDMIRIFLSNTDPHSLDVSMPTRHAND